jgi:hypothetical protein
MSDNLAQRIDSRLRETLAAHFDPATGSPYWLARERELCIDVRARVRRIEDLALFGPFPLADLSRHPLDDFMPRAVRDAPGLVLAETGGTSGEPRPTAYSDDDFAAAFVRPFLARTAAHDFGDGRWLWLGPGGPHVIGKAAQRIARLTTGADAFSVDFDPRWFRRLAAGTLARTRYLDHVLEQALRVLRLQRIAHLFTTPVVLTALASHLSVAERRRIGLLYLGGMPLAPPAMQAIAEAFPRAVCLAGYGNTLFGVSHEARLAPARADPPRYVPDSARLIVRIVPTGIADLRTRIASRVSAGERGQVMMHRLDASGFLPNVLERDAAVRIDLGADQDGLEDPRPLERAGLHIDNGIY